MQFNLRKNTYLTQQSDDYYPNFVGFSKFSKNEVKTVYDKFLWSKIT